MGIRYRLRVMNFLQYFIWGSWLISLGSYLGNTLHFTGGEIGSIFATMGIASLFMPGLLGIVADRWINAERLLGVCHLTGAGLLFWASTVTTSNLLYLIMLFNAMAYMPTIALNNTVSYHILEGNCFNIVKDFPPIRVWGTIGFICAMWVVDLCGWGLSPLQLWIGSASSLFLGIYAFTMPACPPVKSTQKRSLLSAMGFDAFVLFRKRKMAVFFIFAMLLGAALQITNTFGQSFLHDFTPNYSSSFAVVHPGLLMSVSQISEVLFILAIPYFLHRFGIQRVMMISIFAWVARFGLFGIGNPGDGLFLLILSMIIYGIAFDFFLISGSLFVEMETDTGIRASAQGLFMIMVNGIGAFAGGVTSGRVVDYFTHDGIKEWQNIWFTFAGYALLLGLVFPLVFRYKHNSAVIKPAEEALIFGESNLLP